MLRILGKASSINVRKVLWACAETDRSFEREDWGSGFRATDTPEFMALNPNAMVPVILEDDFVLWESNTIIRYLASVHPDEGFYPSQPRARARIDQWIDWQATDLNKSWTYAFMSLVRRSAEFQDRDALKASSSSWARHMQILDRQLELTGAYVAGESFTLADIPVGLSVNRWFETPLDHPEFPAVAAYYERLSERPGYLLYGRNGTP
ncbi:MULTISPECIES: glutathione S-transferase family protein [Pseudomonas]|uniref:Glutathione S-transferase n=1 Tax=Pseudomonas cichorii TaxID=36746 RepID=A0A3M4WGF3_PSECI|nr:MULTISPECIES: glutathione S-transferase [Pseudomonas]AHF67649.1 glutathione S-transferase [Pseudomonas cichorii JBC1]QVE19487.1 glutathione S-transferase [Pseudomonas cichorii]RMR62402.1 Glutathione S-transferase [Pseudomonas cichorii]SDO85839.1 glutathione S-transferase [Pseudomonas cichorii]GFM77957.1 glutathione S-transferase [Pseudomonas cichorii]